MNRLINFLIGLALALLVILLASSCSHSITPKRIPSEEKQQKFVTVWCVVGGVVIMWAVQDGHENRERK